MKKITKNAATSYNFKYYFVCVCVCVWCVCVCVCVVCVRFVCGVCMCGVCVCVCVCGNIPSPCWPDHRLGLSITMVSVGRQKRVVGEGGKVPCVLISCICED